MAASETWKCGDRAVWISDGDGMYVSERASGVIRDLRKGEIFIY